MILCKIVFYVAESKALMQKIKHILVEWPMLSMPCLVVLTWTEFNHAFLQEVQVKIVMSMTISLNTIT